MLRIDALRFIASVGIVVLHVPSMMDGVPAAVTDALANLRMCVDLFFVISGLVIMMFYADKVGTLSGYALFLQRRVARIGPLHWATLLLFLLILMLATVTDRAVNEPARYDVRCIVPNILLIHSFGVCDQRTFNFVSWSISAELALYALFPVFAIGARFFRAYFWIPAMACAALLALLDPVWSERTFDLGVMRAAPSFLFGMSLYGARHFLKDQKLFSYLVVPFGVAFVGGALARSDPFILLMLAYGWVASAYAADLRRKAGPAVVRIGPLGQLTYSMYMLHPVLMTFGITIAGRLILHLQGAALNLWIAVLFLGVLPVLSCASLYFFEMPLRRLLSTERGKAVRPVRGASG
jgi:peptidoglycan/LPS O-acetylase OafA/YrhL